MYKEVGLLKNIKKNTNGNNRNFQLPTHKFNTKTSNLYRQNKRVRSRKCLVYGNSQKNDQDLMLSARIRIPKDSYPKT